MRGIFSEPQFQHEACPAKKTNKSMIHSSLRDASPSAMHQTKASVQGVPEISASSWAWQEKSSMENEAVSL
jgi:hypothetical protein